MTHVLTLVAATTILDAAILARAAQAIASLGPVPAPPQWLEAGRAADIRFLGADAALAQKAVRSALAGAPIDLLVQQEKDRRKLLLVADMDATITAGESLDELAAEAGIKERVAAITARAMNGELDFAAALRERVALLAGLPEAALQRGVDRLALNPGAGTLVRTMAANGAYTALVSGGFRPFTRRAKELAGFAFEIGNEIEVAAGKLTGRVREPILDRDAKRATLERLRVEIGLARAQTIAVGDGANDLPMLLQAGLGVAYRAKPVVAASAPAQIEHADLTALLFFQGYARTQFKD
jgi:phosphoserine phosphatase